MDKCSTPTLRPVARTMDDVDEFVAALKQHHESMRALAVRTMHDQSLADDALQNAYTSAFTNRASFRGDAAFSTWLYRIVYRSCIDEIRRRKPTSKPMCAPPMAIVSR